jgi:hypothetical protein
MLTMVRFEQRRKHNLNDDGLTGLTGKQTALLLRDDKSYPKKKHNDQSCKTLTK